jgi:predicted  nucleic acid-binding Zn-ribbon protein
MSAGVGADVEALCSKCGDVWHVVVAKVGEKIVKVHCKQCGGDHRYKSPHGAPAEKKLPSAIRPAREPKAPVERFEKPAVAADLTKASKPYRASEMFEVGERIDHPSFGQGVIEISEPGKITVFFASGRRVLAQARTAPPAGSLVRPKPFDHSNPPAGGKPVSET